MADRRDLRAGFTLIELMLAIGILVIGATSLIGVLTVGVSMRATAEQRSRAVLLADQVLYDLERTMSRRSGPDGETTPLQPLTVEAIDGYPGMKYTVEFVTDAAEPDLVLARVRISWREQGQPVIETFQRILVAEKPFPRRIARMRSGR